MLTGSGDAGSRRGWPGPGLLAGAPVVLAKCVLAWHNVSVAV
jgi:hypothetical protein